MCPKGSFDLLRPIAGQVQQREEERTCYNGAHLRGVVSEWSKEHDWKSCIGQPIVGSNPTRSAILFFKGMQVSDLIMSIEPSFFSPTTEEDASREAILHRILDFIQRGERIVLPEWDRSPQSLSDYALLNVGLEPNDFGSFVGEWRYQFEGEDDLLHLMICRRDQGAMPGSEARGIVDWLLKGVPTGLYWVKHATHSHHFYVGHDILPDSLEI